MMEKKRVSYYDLAKGFGIILVVLGHVEYISAGLRGWISSFHMPMFFVISGMLVALKNEKEAATGELVKKKFRGIMLPYFWFSLIYFPIDIFNIVRGNIDMHTFWQDQIYSINCYGISVMWFLPALFIGEISAILLIKLVSDKCSRFYLSKTEDSKNNNPNLVISIIMLILAVIVSVVFYYIWQPLDKIFLANEQDYAYAAFFGFLKVIFRGIILSVFIVAGYVFQNMITFFENKKTADGSTNPTAGDTKRHKIDVPALMAGIVLFVLNMFMSLYNGSIDTHYLILKNLPMFYLCAFTGSIAVILICKGIGSIKFIQYFGRNSLIIMATHIQFFILYISLLVAFKIDQYTTFAKHHIFIFSTVACVMVLEIPVIEVINRFFPFILGKRLKRNNSPDK